MTLTDSILALSVLLWALMTVILTLMQYTHRQRMEQLWKSHLEAKRIIDELTKR